jgi:2-polyprenyl-3-methyl-5-hydroxy-6-metoxy-1,4-benzoquinol methylase
MSSVEKAEHILSQILEAEKAISCGQESRHRYVDMHQARFADIMRLCQSQVPNPSARVLDIGRSELTAYLLNHYKNVHTLGFDPSIDDGGHREISKMDDTVHHITFDLLNSHNVSGWPDTESFDLIVFSEVIEHLCVAPEFVFAFLCSLLSSDGVLVCTTPNATDIAKRIRLIFGRNPYERLRLYSTNPGHIREYTRQELREIVDSVGLSCISHSYFNWIPNRGGSRLKAQVMRVLRLYPPFRQFQACVLAKKNCPR